ncbi:retrovirus-related pol polyprotein from transposon TNT 1-94 [Tanacetum coccineum]
MSLSLNDSDPLTSSEGQRNAKELHYLQSIQEASTNLPTTILRTSSHSRNKTEDTTTKYSNGQSVQGRIGSTLQLMQRSGVSPEKAILLATLNRVQNHDERKQKDFKAIKKANASLTKNWKSVKTNLDETNSALWKSTVLDETPEVLKDFLTMIQRNLQAQVITVRTDRGTEFLNKTLHAYFKEEGIEHQTSTPRTPEQNGVVERRNRTLVEAARTMLSASKLPLSFWAEAVATACYTQNNAIINHSMERRRITHYDW